MVVPPLSPVSHYYLVCGFDSLIAYPHSSPVISGLDFGIDLGKKFAKFGSSFRQSS
jgi:hypothetical protein